MSLVRIAERICAVEALKGRTLVEGNVLDSPNGALDVQADGSMRTDAEKPFIAIYTDRGQAEGVMHRGLYENGLCDIVFEIGISTPMVETDQKTGASVIVGIGIPASDQGFEFFLDIVQRQIIDVLNDPDNEWSEIYRGLHSQVLKTEYVGARNTDDGQRLAGHQLRKTVRLVDDPYGAELTPGAPFTRFLEKIEASADPVYVSQAAAIRALFGGDSEPLSVVRRGLGFTQSEIEALGLSNLGGSDGEPFENASINVEGMDR
jgi:hypothetical protein